MLTRGLEAIVERAAGAVATIWAVYFVLILVLVPLAVPGITTQVQFVSSAVFQAVMLPVLAYMSVKVQRQGDAAQAQAVQLQRETHDIVRTSAADLALDLKEERHIEALLAKIEAMESRDAATERKILGAIERLAKAK